MFQSISLSAPDHRLPQSLLRAPGAFIWWYIDAVNESGDGFVLIWSWGLPFLPGYAAAERRGKPLDPLSCPSLNLAIYKAGELDYYMLHEFEADECTWDGDSKWRFGDCVLESIESQRQRSLKIALKCPVPGTDEVLQGHIELNGVARIANQTHVSSDHDWSPLTGPSHARADLALGEERWEIEGRGYFDRNGGTTPLHKLPIDHWLWGRLPFDGCELIYYLLWPIEGDPEFLALIIDSEGQTQHLDNLEVEKSDPRFGLAGTWWKTLNILSSGEPFVRVVVESVLDDGPFYMRYQVRAHWRGQESLGMGELCVPDRIDRAIHRPLVRMRVQHSNLSKNSLWLPLFTGPRRGRVQRLLKSWVPG